MNERFGQCIAAWLARRFSWKLPPPDRTGPRPRPQLLVVVEGRHDIEFLKRISALVTGHDARLPNLSELEASGAVVFVPAGGGDFRPWLARLGAFCCCERHVYDRELPPVSAQREAWAALVNRRERCRAFVTGKRALENYLHPAAILEASGLRLQFTAWDDVAELAAGADFSRLHGQDSWHALSRRARRRWRDRAKRWLNTTAVARMTPARLAHSDPRGEVIAWLQATNELLRSVP